MEDKKHLPLTEAMVQETEPQQHRSSQTWTYSSGSLYYGWVQHPASQPAVHPSVLLFVASAVLGKNSLVCSECVPTWMLCHTHLRSEVLSWRRLVKNEAFHFHCDPPAALMFLFFSWTHGGGLGTETSGGLHSQLHKLCPVCWM